MTYIDSLKIYCSATGKPIADIADDEAGAIIESLPSDKLETLALLSMRPSILWMSVTGDSLERIRLAAPKQLLAYLMNRMYAPIEHSHQRPMRLEDRLAALRFRVNMWETIDAADFDSEKLNQLLMVLLEIDSRVNLSRTVKPAYIASVLQGFDLDSLLQSLVSWRDSLAEAELKAIKQARASTEFWSNGNRLTRKPFLNALVDTKPITKAAEKRQAKRADENLFDSILDGIMSPADISSIHVPTAPPIVSTFAGKVKASRAAKPSSRTPGVGTTIQSSTGGFAFKFGVK